jgi:hypothetical protein
MWIVDESMLMRQKIGGIAESSGWMVAAAAVGGKQAADLFKQELVHAVNTLN